jgi:dihydropyrimidinase
MSEFDLVIRGGEVITAADRFRADVGVRGGKIVAVAERLAKGAREIDASSLLVMPSGIDSHVHFAQPSNGGPKMADGFESGTRSAIAGGNTTVIPFAVQRRGGSLCKCVTNYHKEAEGQSYCD